MRIICPSCTAAYDVADSLLKPRRKVRCVRCGEEWEPLADEPPAIEQAEAAPAPVPAWEEQPELRPSAMERLAQSPAVLPGRSLALPAAWTASVVALLLLVGGAYVWRSDVMRIWPPSARLYDMVGLVEPPPR